MKRAFMQVYVKDSCSAAKLYTKAFGANIISETKSAGGGYIHAELEIRDYIIALSEAGDEKTITGNTMQLCFQFGENGKAAIDNAVEVLRDGAKILYPAGPCAYSSYMTDLIDKFGVRWCLFE